LIPSLSIGVYRCVVSDALGRTSVASIGIGSASQVTGKRRRIDGETKNGDNDGDAHVIRQYQIGPYLPQETGWTGAALNPTKTEQVATVGYFSRRLDLWNEDKCTRSIHTPLNPTQV
jgi:hypothetical protein